MSSCLVVIDVQKGFINHTTEHIIPLLQALLESGLYDHIVATKFINEKGSPYRQLLDWSGMSDALSQELHPSVKKHAERIFKKYGYTCFTKEFEDFLIRNKVDRLTFVGVDTDACVQASAFSAFDRGIKFEVLANYCASCAGSKAHEYILSVMKRNFGSAVVYS